MDTAGKHRKFKRSSMALVFILVLVGIFTCVSVAQSKNPQSTRKTAGLKPGIDIIDTVATENPGGTDIPDVTEEPASTLEPGATPHVSSSPEPSVSPTKPPVRLKAVSGVKLTRYSTHSVKVTWNENKKAKFYRVYYYKKNGSAHLAGVTKNTQYLVKKLKNNTTYYFYIVAGKKKKASDDDSNFSKKVHIKTKAYVHKTIFAGDSICEGIADYGQAFPQMKFTGKKKVIAYRGLNTVTFHTKRIFDGKTGLQKLIAEKPYRVYMMLGINEVFYKKTGDMIAEYKSMIQAIRQESPETDIVLCAISPVTREERGKYPGYSRVPAFNKKLEKLAKKSGAIYFDYTDFLKDSDGYLKAEYAAGDGYHWKVSAYTVFGKIVNKFEKSLDK